MRNHKKILSGSWFVLLTLTISFIYLHTFLEWIFFITKPSFMSGMPLGSQVKIYFLTAFGLSVLPILTIAILAYLDRILKAKNAGGLLVSIGVLIPVLAFSSVVLILVDNNRIQSRLCTCME